MGARLTVEGLEDRDCPAPLLASAGGWVYGLDPDTGAVARSRQLDPGFAGPLHPAALPGGDFVVGAGFGGGPRLVRYDGLTWAEEWSVFVGDPASRTGVDPAALAAYDADLSPITAYADPSGPPLPEDVAQVEARLAAMHDGIERWLAAEGQEVVVFRGEITRLPQFARYAGAPGWGNVGGLGPLRAGDPVYIRDDNTGSVAHEVAHAIFSIASAERYRAGDLLGRWDYRWQAEVYPLLSPAGRGTRGPGEAAADRLAEYAAGVPVEAPADAFFDEMAAAYRWGVPA